MLIYIIIDIIDIDFDMEQEQPLVEIPIYMVISFQIQFAKLYILSTEYPFCSCFIILEQSNLLSARLYDLSCHPVLNDGYHIGIGT